MELNYFFLIFFLFQKHSSIPSGCNSTLLISDTWIVGRRMYKVSR